jgi:hypothetical protein
MLDMGFEPQIRKIVNQARLLALSPSPVHARTHAPLAALPCPCTDPRPLSACRALAAFGCSPCVPGATAAPACRSGACAVTLYARSHARASSKAPGPGG